MHAASSGTGPKRMLVKNFRPARKVDPKVFLEQTWGKVEGALDTVFAQGEIDFSLEELYRGVENLCRQGMAGDVCERLVKKCRGYVGGELRGKVTDMAGRKDVDVLRGCLGAWGVWMDQMVRLLLPQWIAWGWNKGMLMWDCRNTSTGYFATSIGRTCCRSRSRCTISPSTFSEPLTHIPRHTLPSIVVIGSQSSGKSSVLEAIVGHEFLPKGSNMVTRRPIELTLVNTPDAQAEYGEFPALGLGKVTDFSQIQKTLTDLNLAVPASQCVTDDPIQLRIYSPNVPHLSLIDLPGYIQVTGRDQPPELKEKIAELCERYIQPPNVILAISAADVDLANSTALRASRKVDPRGERTIGVITKMDLVDPDRGASLLSDKKYALRLGYVGVVCRVPANATGSKLFNRGNGNITNAIAKNENAYFSSHAEFGPESHLDTGTKNLRKKLMHVLEQTMAASLKTTGEAIQRELAEATYEYKVQYNERPLSAESYLAESLDAFKHSFRGFTDQFGRQQVRELLKQELDQQVLNLLAQRYWNKPFEDLSAPLPESDPLSSLAKADPEGEQQIWQIKLDSSSAALTKLGVGRLATSVVASALQAHIDRLVSVSRFSAHPFARQAISEASTSILRDLSYDIADELEICIKPYKYRIEVEDNEWAKGRENVGNVLKDELKVCEAAVKKLEDQVGGRKKVRDVMAFIDRVRSGQVVLEGDGIGGAGGFSAALLQKGMSKSFVARYPALTCTFPGREAVFLRDRVDVLKMRLLAVKSKQCANKKNKYHCPEVFLDAVADKLTTTADLFLDAELLSKFYYIVCQASCCNVQQFTANALQFPRELDARLGRGLSQSEIDRFAREDPKIRRHLDVVRRKELLEHVLKEMESLRQLEAREKRYTARREEGRERRKGGWSLF
jgi:dynamin-like GTPase MGM1, mitochondrial